MTQRTQNETAKTFILKLEKQLAMVTDRVKELRDCVDENGDVHGRQLLGALTCLAAQTEDLLNTAKTGFEMTKISIEE